jgi:hypothetical protein
MPAYFILLCISIILTPLAVFPVLSGNFGIAKICGALALILFIFKSATENAKLNSHKVGFEIPLLIILGSTLINIDYGHDAHFYRIDIGNTISMVSLYLLVFLIVNSLKRVRDFNRFVWAYFLSSVIPCVSAIQQGVFNVDMFGRAAHLFKGRAIGTYNGAAGIALLSETVFCLSFTYFIFNIGFKKIPYLLVAILNFWGGYYSYTRTYLAVILMGVIASVSLIVFKKDMVLRKLFEKKPRLKKYSVLIQCGMIVVVFGVASYGYVKITQSPNWMERIDKTINLERNNKDEVRTNDFYYGLSQITDMKNFMGVGMGNYYRMAKDTEVSFSWGKGHLSGVPHNFFMHFLIMGGIFGLICMIIMGRVIFKSLYVKHRGGKLENEWTIPLRISMLSAILALLLQGATMNNNLWTLFALIIANKFILIREAKTKEASCVAA